jgi:tRNA nucleotidyltransferase (CCA-adding enzyme)
MKETLFKLALRVAHHESPTLNVAELGTMCCAVQMNAFEGLSSAARWELLTQALMAPHPAHFFEALRTCAGLSRLLPELDGLFGVPQLSDGPEPMDVGWHQLRLVDLTAQVGAPLAVRFAALMHKIGKGGTPVEILPSHYKHEQRGGIALDALAQRIQVPDDALDLAHLAVAECDRVHRASDARAGAIAAMLERLQVLERPERFEQLLTVCTCDYAAYPGHGASEYPKAARLRRAWSAYASAHVDGQTGDEALETRTRAIALALRGSTSLHGDTLP